jgi:hypothetical protein
MEQLALATPETRSIDVFALSYQKQRLPFVIERGS